MQREVKGWFVQPGETSHPLYGCDDVSLEEYGRPAMKHSTPLIDMFCGSLARTKLLQTKFQELADLLHARHFYSKNSTGGNTNFH